MSVQEDAKKKISDAILQLVVVVLLLLLLLLLLLMVELMLLLSDKIKDETTRSPRLLERPHRNPDDCKRVDRK